MASRNDRDRLLAEALQSLAQVVEGQNPCDAGVPAEYQGLDRFQKNNPPSFAGGYDPDGSQKWLREIEKIF